MQENRNVVIRCFTVALFILMLFSIRLFVYPEMWTHVVAITTALLLFVTGMWKRISVKEIPVSLSLFLCWGIYIAVYAIWQGSEMYSVTFLLSSCLLYYSTYRLSCGEVLSLPFARRVVIACAVIEAVVCLLQWGGFLPGTSLYFSVTGTFWHWHFRVRLGKSVPVGKRIGCGISSWQYYCLPYGCCVAAQPICVSYSLYLFCTIPCLSFDGYSIFGKKLYGLCCSYCCHCRGI
mgnify:CR=1 FL=1